MAGYRRQGGGVQRIADIRFKVGSVVMRAVEGFKLVGGVVRKIFTSGERRVLVATLTGYVESAGWALPWLRKLSATLTAHVESEGWTLPWLRKLAATLTGRVESEGWLLPIKRQLAGRLIGFIEALAFVLPAKRQLAGTLAGYVETDAIVLPARRQLAGTLTGHVDTTAWGEQEIDASDTWTLHLLGIDDPLDEAGDPTGDLFHLTPMRIFS